MSIKHWPGGERPPKTKAHVHPRTVVKRVLSHNVAAVIFAHNHPSPSLVMCNLCNVLNQNLRENPFFMAFA